MGQVGTRRDEWRQVGTIGDEWGQVGTCWNQLGQVGMSWEPKKLQNFDIKKTSREERKKEEEYRIESRLEREATNKFINFNVFFL